MLYTQFSIFCDSFQAWIPRISIAIVLLFFTFYNSLFSQKTTDLVDILLGYDEPFFRPYFTPNSGYEIQLIYGEIDRTAEKTTIHRKNYGLSDEYYYPASSVKLPIAVLALEYINQLGIEGLDMHSRLEHGAKHAPQAPAVADSSAQTLYPSVAHYMRKIFLYSDNDAYNRLFEMLGQRYINQRLQDLGVEHTRLLHRVGISGFGPAENQWINPVSFYEGEELLSYKAASKSSWQCDITPEAQLRGKGFMKEGALINSPMDFSQKNYIPLASLLSVLQKVILPEAYPIHQRFDLTDEQYQQLWKAMGQYPSESDYPSLPDMEDGYVKFFLNGGAGDRKADHIRILNKVGFAYGYLTDVAYIVDLNSGVEFFVGGVIHVNENRIFNDDTYEYDKGLAFLKRVGEVLLEHEQKNVERQRNPLKLKRYADAIKN